MEYTAKDYQYLKGMPGFSDDLLEDHFTLYKGYVTNTNKLHVALVEMAATDRNGSPEFAELKRRFGFEFNGMRLHELYFGNLGVSGKLDMGTGIGRAIERAFGTKEVWEADFKATGKMRGIGWVVLYLDTTNGGLFNQWINEHETGHLAGCLPLLVMDVFEHAFIRDYGLKRADYIEAFFGAINWEAVERRLK
ncbi:MAG: Fe-Mn family superoxide dismutase [Dehalococcoidales bacterium]|jgi:Fe-Mn family superoxide dismutase|nr:Fe-Mn family superoxide dismutase [Dehalococcoidales bacterium]MDD4465909.1 Fe-Mn family superoxide dismutase [Dehalococcoidales bacterium]